MTQHIGHQLTTSRRRRMIAVIVGTIAVVADLLLNLPLRAGRDFHCDASEEYGATLQAYHSGRTSYETTLAGYEKVATAYQQYLDQWHEADLARMVLVCILLPLLLVVARCRLSSIGFALTPVQGWRHWVLLG